MDAVKFVKEYLRMCSQPWDCEDCPLNKTDFCSAPAKKRSQGEAEEVVRLVEEWSAAHPRKTRQDLFLEQWTDANLENGVLHINPCRVDSNFSKNVACDSLQCPKCQRGFWMQEVVK